MLYQLKRFLYPVVPTIIPQWTEWIKDDLEIRKRELRRRFINNYGYDSRALRLLKHIVGSIDLDYLKSQRNDFEMYVNYFSNFGTSADHIFNATKFGKAYRNVFYTKTLFTTTEYLIPTNSVDHIKTLPLGESWDVWQHVKPVTLWYNDSFEYSLNMLNDQVKFKYDQPNYAITFIDSIALSMMWYKYFKEPMISDEDRTIHVFLHRYVFSKLFDDLEDIWLLNQVKSIAEHVDELDILNRVKSDPLFGYTGKQKEASLRLSTKLMDIRNGNLRPNNLLSERLLYSGSILDKIHYSFNYLDTENLKQYEYTRILRDLPYLELILKLHGWRPDSSYYRSLTQELRIILKRYMSSKPWSSVVDSTIKLILQNTIESMYNKIKIN